MSNSYLSWECDDCSHQEEPDAHMVAMTWASHGYGAKVPGMAERCEICGGNMSWYEVEYKPSGDK